MLILIENCDVSTSIQNGNSKHMLILIENCDVSTSIQNGNFSSLIF